MKPKEGSAAKVSSGLKAFRTVWTNDSGIDNDQVNDNKLGQAERRAQDGVDQ